MRTLGLSLALALAANVAVSAQRCVENDADVQGLTIRAVTVDARFARVPAELRATLAAHRGETYSSESAVSFIREVNRYLAERPGEIENAVGALQSLAVKVDRGTVCATEVPANDCAAAFPAGNRCIDVLVQSTSVQLDVYDVSGNLLPVPRSNQLRFFSTIPAPLLAFNPQVNVTRDSRIGLQPSAAISTDLLSLPTTLGTTPASRAQTGVTPRSQLWVALHGARSVDEPFYEAGGRLSFVRKRPATLVDRIAVNAEFGAIREPRGVDDAAKEVLEESVDLGMRLPGSVFDRLRFGGGYRSARNHFVDVDASRQHLTERAFDVRLVADGQMAGGFARAATWFDRADPDGRQAYSRWAALIGFQRELAVATNQSVGIESLAGIGRSVGTMPAYAGFLAGTPLASFLYDGIDGRSLSSMPSGPVLRSSGHNQLGANGSAAAIAGDAYWHANLTVSVPIPRLSRPLIPAEIVSILPNGTARTLKDVLKNQVGSGQELYVRSTARQRLSEDEQQALQLDSSQPLTPEERERSKRAADAYVAAQNAVRPQADRLWSKITPITGFIADQANLYAIKPLIMFDVARINSSAVPDALTRIGIGAGVQLTVVVAQFEAGYVRAVRRLDDDPPGNFVIRLVLRNLF
jgi:hypothetical protein